MTATATATATAAAAAAAASQEQGDVTHPAPALPPIAPLPVSASARDSLGEAIHGERVHELHDDDPDRETVTGNTLPAVDTSAAAWRFVLAGLLLDLFVWGGTFAWGSYQEFYLSSTVEFRDVSPVTMSVVGSVALALNYAEMLMGIILCKRYPHLVRRGIWTCLVLYVLAMVIASFATEIWTLILFQGILAGSMGGLMYAPIYVYLQEWFLKRRALAGGCVFAGAGVGGFAWPLLLDALLPRIGFRWTLRVMALLSAVCCGFALIFIKPRIPVVRPALSRRRRASASTWRSRFRFRFVSSKVWRRRSGQRGRHDDGGEQESRDDVEWEKERANLKARRRAERPDVQYLWDAKFLVVSLTILVQGFLYSPLLVYIPTYVTTFPTATAFQGNVVLALMNAASVLGQILCGALCDRVPYVWVMGSSGAICCVLVLGLLRVAGDVPKITGFAIVVGLIAGGFSSTWFPASRDIALSRPPLRRRPSSSSTTAQHNVVVSLPTQAQTRASGSADHQRAAEQAGPIFGYLAIVRGLSSIIGPILAGSLYTHRETVTVTATGQDGDSDSGSGTGNENDTSSAWGRYGWGDGFVQFLAGMSAAVVVGAAGILVVDWVRSRRRRQRVRRDEGDESGEGEK